MAHTAKKKLEEDKKNQGKDKMPRIPHGSDKKKQLKKSY